MSSARILQLDGAAVVVVTATERPVSIGRLVVSTAARTTTPHVDIKFATENMTCILGVPASRLEELTSSWDGEMYRYQLPPGDSVWVSTEEAMRYDGREESRD